MVEADWERCRFCGHDLSAPVAAVGGPVLPGAPPPPSLGVGAETPFDPSVAQRSRLPWKRVLLGLGAAYLVYAVIAFFVIGEPWTETNSHGVEVMSGRAIATVCDGKGGAEGTARYEPGGARSPMQVARKDGDSWQRVAPPYHEDGRFQGEPASEIELVACYRPDSDPPKTYCRFERGLNVYVEHYSVLVDVREASTGALVADDLVRPDDQRCPLAVMVEDGVTDTTVLPHREIDRYLIAYSGR